MNDRSDNFETFSELYPLVMASLNGEIIPESYYPVNSVHGIDGGDPHPGGNDIGQPPAGRER